MSGEPLFSLAIFSLPSLGWGVPFAAAFATLSANDERLVAGARLRDQYTGPRK